jgi:acyl carrier protein
VTGCRTDEETEKSLIPRDFRAQGHTDLLYRRRFEFMSIEDKVVEIIVEQLDVTKEECVPEASFIDDLGADSLDIVELIMALEENFSIEINDDELRKIRTIQDSINFIKKKKGLLS